MNDKDLQVVLQAIIDIDGSGKNIQAQLATLKQKLPNLELDIDANFDLDSLLKQFNKLKKTFSETRIDNEWISTTTKLKDNLGKTIEIVKRLNKLTGETSYKVTPTIDLEKQEKSLEKQAELAKEIRNTLDNIPSVFKETQAVDDFYDNLKLLDTSDSVDDFKQLKKEVDSYYKDVINLEKEYQKIKENTLKEEEDKVDFIYQKRKQLLDLERQINTLSTTKGVNTGNYTPEIENLRSVLGGLSTTGESLYDNQRNEINQIVDSLKQKLSLEKDSLNIQKLQEEAQIKINNARQNLNDIIAKNGKYDENQYDKLNNSLDTLESNLKSGAISSQDFNLQMKKLSPEMKQFETEARKASASTSTLSSRFKRFLSFYSFYDALQLGKRLIREVATEIKALDDSILEVNKILNLSTNEMDKFVSKAYSMGEALSRTGRDMIDSTGTLVKAGYSNLDEAMNFAGLALSMKNVGDNMNDVERNANVLISTMKGYGDESYTFAEKTLNVLNEVSNTSAITFSDLAEAFTRTSAVYSQAEVSIEKLAGMATGANEIIQNIEKSSSGLLIITQRIRGVSSSFEEDPENISKLDTALRKIANVDIKDTTGQLRDTYSILTDISKVYPSLTKNQQAYISELISGKRQKAVFEALMANWNKVEKATESAMNSAGSYAQEQEAYFNSISGHLARLESAWQSLATSSMDSDFVKSLIDTVTWIVKLTDACGGLQVVLGGLILSFISFRAILKTDSLLKLVEGFVKVSTTATIAGKAVTSLTLAGKLLTGGIVVATVMAIGYGINYLATQSERAEKEVKVLSDSLKELSKANDDLNKLANNFEKLSGTKNKKPEQIQELIETQNQLKELLPNLKGYYDELGNFNIETDKEKSNLSELVGLQEKSLELEREKLNLASKRVVDYSIDDYEKESKRLKQLIELQKLNKKYAEEGLSRQEQQKRTRLTNITGLSAGETLGGEIEKARDSIDKSLTDITDKFINSVSDSEEWSRLTTDRANAVRKAFSELDKETLIGYVDKIKNGSLTTKEFIKTMLNTPSAIGYLEDALNEVGSVIDDATESINTFEKAIESLSGTRSKIESLQSILEKLSSGNLSASDMEQLLSISEEFLPYLNDEIALREKLSQSITEYKDTYQQSYYEILDVSEEYYNAKITGDNDLYTKLTNNLKGFFNDLGIAYNGDLKNYKNLENAKAKLTSDLISQLAGGWSKYFNAFTGELLDPRIGWGGGGLGQDSELIKIYNEIQTAKNNLDELINNTVYEPIDIKFDESSVKSSADKVISEIDRLKQELDAILQDKEFDISLLEFSGEDISKQISVYQQMQDAVHDLAQKYRAMGLSENNDYIQQLRTQWMDYASTISSLEATSFDNSNKDIDRNITQLELEQQLLKENSQEYIDIENKKYDEIVKREQLLQAEISRLQSIGTANAVEQAESLIDAYYDTVSQRYNIIKNLQSSQISIYNDQIDELEKQKSALEDLHEFTMQMIKDELNAKKKSVQEEIKGIEEVFNRRKQALRDEQDTRNYEKGLTEKSSVVADLENQLALIKNDETAIAKRKQLEQELTDAKEDLADYQYDNSIALAEKALDEQLEIQKSALEEEIEELDDTLSNEVKMRELANKRIEKSGQKLKDQLIAHAKEYGTFTIEEVTNAWEIAGEAVDDFNLKQLDLLDTLGLVADKLKEVQADLKAVERQSVNDYANSIGASTSYNRSDTEKHAQMVANSKAWTSASSDKKLDLELDNQKLGKELGYTYDPQTGIWYKKNGMRAYHTGGIVGGNNYATKSTEELAKLLKGELVITPPQADKVMDMITNNSNSNINISMPIVIEGNADSDTVKSLEKQVGKIADTVIEKLNTARTNTGFKKKPKFV